jgi:hypothetical protein
MSDQIIPNTENVDIALIATALSITLSSISGTSTPSDEELAKRFARTFRTIYDAVKASGKYGEKSS